MVQIIEKRQGPIRIKFNPKRTLVNLSEVDHQLIKKRHIRQRPLPLSQEVKAGNERPRGGLPEPAFTK